MGIDLPVVWAAIIAFGLMMYVIMDGFDLGIGILLPFVRDPGARDVMINTVAPVWDGNETWLVLGGAGLLAAFPIAYSLLLSALYIPLLLMLAALIWRGTAFEFRFKAQPRHKWFWDKAFIWGSCTATVCQGLALGAFLNGFQVSGPSYEGGAFDWLTPFSVFTGLSLLAAYALLGSTWLIMKTDGRLQERMFALARPITLVLLACIVVVSIWTPLTHAEVAARWFRMPNLVFFAPVPVLVLIASLALILALHRRREIAPFLLALFLIFLGYSGLAISIWPNIVPPALSIRAAAAPPESMGFTLVGALLIIPMILMYTAWSYFVFRGKVKLGEGYH